MIDKPLEEAEELFKKHSKVFPFMDQLSYRMRAYRAAPRLYPAARWRALALRQVGGGKVGEQQRRLGQVDRTDTAR